jgi:hypothetical protein
MMPDQLAAYRKRLADIRQPDDKLSPERAFLRGWNSALDAAESNLKDILGERREPAPSDR